MLSKILVPVDGSKNAFRALDHAIYLANKVNVHVTAINVMENPPKVYVESQKLLDEILANFKAEATNILDQCRNQAAKSGVRIETVILEGDETANKIVQYAEDGAFDTIIMGRRGLGKFKTMMLGSISNTVLQHADCSVMIVK